MFPGLDVDGDPAGMEEGLDVGRASEPARVLGGQTIGLDGFETYLQFPGNLFDHHTQARVDRADHVFHGSGGGIGPANGPWLIHLEIEGPNLDCRPHGPLPRPSGTDALVVA